MRRIRLHGLRCLIYAIGLLVLSPVVIEFALRVQAFRATTNSSPTEPQPLVIASPVMHHQLAPLQQVRLHSASTAEDAQDISFKTNSLGLAGPEIAIPKPEGVYRIVCVGDETVLAANMPESLTFPQHIAAKLKPFAKAKLEVINAAVPGYSPVLEALQVRHQLQLLQPDLIVAHFDISDPAENRRHLRLTDLSSDETPLACVNPSLSSTPKIKSACEHFLCVNWVKQSVNTWVGQQAAGHSDETQMRPQEWLKDPAFTRSDELKAALMPFDHLASHVERSGTRVLVVVHPWVDHMISGGKPGDAEAKPGVGSLPEVFTQFEQSTGILMCHIQPYLARLPDADKALQADHRHLSDKGHEIYGYAIAATILHRVSGPWVVPSRGPTASPVTEAQHTESRPPATNGSGVVRANRQESPARSSITRPENE